MKSRKRRPAAMLPVMTAQLAMASWETILRRTVLMASGSCSPAEYRRMVREKAAAMQLSAAALMLGRDPSAVLRPWHLRATRNARRLRKG